MSIMSQSVWNLTKRVDLIKCYVRRFSTHRYLSQQRPQLTESYCHGTSTRPFISKTFGQVLDDAANKWPDQEAFVFCSENKRRTFRQFREEVDRLAAGFLSIGLQKGDRVGIWGPNILEWVLTQFAAAKMGAILVNVNPAFRQAELEYCVKQVGMKAIVSSATFKTQKYYEMLRELCPELADCKPGNLQSERLPDLKILVIIDSDKLPGTFKFDEVLEIGKEEHFKEVKDLAKILQSDDPVSIHFTSGTTGLPKGALLTHHSLLNNGIAFNLGLGVEVDGSAIEKGTKYLLNLPLYHTAGMLIGATSPVIAGVTAVFPSQSFDPEASLKAAHNERTTMFGCIPTMVISMLNHPSFKQYDLSSINTAIMGGSSCPVDVMKEIEDRLNLSCLIVYGLTESSPLITMTKASDTADQKLYTVGHPIEHMEVCIKDPQTGRIVPINTRGEVCSRSYASFRGYWNDEEKTRQTLDDAKWLHTGDLGVMDGNGYIAIVGRSKDAIIRGGESIFPVEIEQFLHLHPKIEDVYIVGVPDKLMGEELCACIQIKQGEVLTDLEVKTFCKGQISHFKIPRYIQFVSEFPLTVTGKIQKFKLQAEMSTQLGLP